MTSTTYKKYSEYFEIDETYYPCIDEAAIRSGIEWKDTYPHETFIKLLDDAEKMLSGHSKRSLWIYGSYGTGKSRCAYTLQRIMEAPEKDVREYWDKYEPLKRQMVLLGKILGHKAKDNILTVYQYAGAGAIRTPQEFCFLIQEKIMEALEKSGKSYKKSNNTFKEEIIERLKDDAYSTYFKGVLTKPEWKPKFTQQTAEEIIEELQKDKDHTGIINNILQLAAKEGIRAFSLTTDSLCDWIRDVVKANDIKIVFVWDEFSDFFRGSQTYLEEFQKIVSLCQEIHFYFVIVTHPLTSLAGASESDDSPMSFAQQRFEKVEITLPPNIAFELIGHAFSVKPAARAEWDDMANKLAARLGDSIKAVMKAAKVNENKIMIGMLPIHPMAALVLENIATAFQSNQRSMFDFIKTSETLNAQAFQWFIRNTSPFSERAFLTVDMLWDFFYEKKEYLTPEIQTILSTFNAKSNLSKRENIILKTILIMQAVNQRIAGEIDILRPTDQNLGYVFEGDSDEYASGMKITAKGLVDKEILISVPTPDDKKMYSAAGLYGDPVKISSYKTEALKLTTEKLVEEGPQLKYALELPPYLKLRFGRSVDEGEIPIVTISNFDAKMNGLKTKDDGTNWHFLAVLALAKTEQESSDFRKKIKATISNDEYRNITVIDALSTPLGDIYNNKYAGYVALARYYEKSLNNEAITNRNKAQSVLEGDWKRDIHAGQFILWNFENKNGLLVNSVDNLYAALQTIVLKRFKYIQNFDFMPGINEGQLKAGNAKQVSKFGIDKEIKGIIRSCADLVLGKVWNKENYWNDADLKEEAISVIKRDVDKLIKEAFKKTGDIAISDIYDLLETRYGFAPSNLTAFVFGFLLKEYKSQPYRYRDSEGETGPMNPEKLSEMISLYMGRDKKESYIVSLTPEEKAFYALTEIAWGINQDTCADPTDASNLIQSKMRGIIYPIWALKELGNSEYDVVEKYINLVQGNGKETHDAAIAIGEIAMQRPNCGQKLKELITSDNCKEGMTIFLKRFENGKMHKLAEDIGAKDRLLSDIKEIFSVEHSAQWNALTGEDEIRKLIVDYGFIKETNKLLNVSNKTKKSAYNSWRSAFDFMGFSCEAIREKRPEVDKLFQYMQQIAQGEDVLPDNMKSFLEELIARNAEMGDILNDPIGVFSDIYAPYLEGFSMEDCEKIKSSIPEKLFVLSETASNNAVKRAVSAYRNDQVRTQMVNLWQEKTGSTTETPKEWSNKYETPILCCVDSNIYGEAKETFRIMNSKFSDDSEIKRALDFLKKAEFFEKLKDEEYRDKRFMECLVGKYEKLLPDIKVIRLKLKELDVDVYDWIDDPKVSEKIINMARAEYKAGGSDIAIKIIMSMGEDELKDWLKKRVKGDMEFGIKFID